MFIYVSKTHIHILTVVNKVRIRKLKELKEKKLLYHKYLYNKICSDQWNSSLSTSAQTKCGSFYKA